MKSGQRIKEWKWLACQLKGFLIFGRKDQYGLKPVEVSDLTNGD